MVIHSYEANRAFSDSVASPIASHGERAALSTERPLFLEGFTAPTPARPLDSYDSFALSTTDGWCAFSAYLDRLKNNSTVHQLMLTLREGEVFNLAVVSSYDEGPSLLFGIVSITHGGYCISYQRNYYSSSVRPQSLKVRLAELDSIDCLHTLEFGNELLPRSEIEGNLKKAQELLALPTMEQRAQIREMNERVVSDERFFGKDGPLAKVFPRAWKWLAAAR